MPFPSKDQHKLQFIAVSLLPYKNLVTTRIGGIRVERSRIDWLVYLETTNFLDKHYEKYRGRPGNERPNPLFEKAERKQRLCCAFSPGIQRPRE